MNTLGGMVPQDRPWRMGLISLGLLGALLGLLYANGFATMVAQWLGSENFAHGILVPPITLWLVWRRRALLATMTPRPSLAGLALLLLAGLLWLVGELASVNALIHFAVVTAVIGLVPLVVGWQVAKALMFQLGFLYLGVPFGEFLYPVLMDATAWFTVEALRLTGIPVYREGLHFVIPSGNWSVIEACSGLRYFVASVMVGVLFAYLNYRSPRRRLAFVAVSFVVPIVANWLRAYMIVMIGHLSGNKLAVGVDHLIYGWVFFGVVMFLMFAIGARFADAPTDEPAPLLPPSPAPIPPVRFAPASLLGALALGAPVLLLAWMNAAISLQAPRLQPWVEPLAWDARAQQVPDWKPYLLKPQVVLHRQLQGPAGENMGLYLGYYRRQTEEHKLISSWNQLISGKDEDWRVARQGLRTVASAGLNVEETMLRYKTNENQFQLLWRSYWIDGHWTADPRKAKLLELAQRLRGHGDDGAVLILHAEASTQGVAEAILGAFLKDNLKLIERQLRRTQGDLVPSTSTNTQ